MATAVIIVLVTAVAALLAKWALWYRRHRALEQAIPGPPSLPVLGNALDFLGLANEDRLKFILGQGDRKMRRLTLLTTVVVMVNNAEDIEHVLRRKDLADKSRFFYASLHMVAKNGLIQLSGPLWREHRKALQPAFSLSILEHFVDYFAEEAEGFVRRVKPWCADDNLLDNLRRVTCGAFMKTTLSEKVGADFEEEILDLIRFLELFLKCSTERFFNPLLWSDWVFGLTARGRLIKKTRAKIDHHARVVLDKRREELRQRGELRGDFTKDFVKRPTTLVDTLLLAPGYRMPDEDVLDEFKTFFAAGVDTTAATIIWLLKALSLHPDIQDKVYAEIQTVFQGSDRRVTPSDLNRLEYTERFIKETLRLFPTVPFLTRQVHEETEFLGHTLPADSAVAINILGAHRDAAHWPDPLKFDPDRFLPENSEGRHPCAYMPFSTGYRNCIGGKYALMNMTTFLATTLRHYRVDPVADGYMHLVDIPLCFDIALRAAGGMTVNFTPRRAAEGA
ncbi:cytochrome P450 4c21-like [Thrips palmi]|uniref:Cytochrome P450 4c21-like n=1 Tax=Thrips palmi TaxID=161013 RepID=A0A6P8YW44_THRPL|nr:cytochrome P450 4c21-like [Thrips palmi]